MLRGELIAAFALQPNINPEQSVPAPRMSRAELIQITGGAATSVRAQLLEERGERKWRACMVELRSIHLEAPRPRRSVFAELQAAFEAAVKLP